MGLEVTGAVRAFIQERIVVPLPDIQASASTRDWLEERITEYLGTRSWEPQLYAPRRFVHFGSYFKGTNVGAVDEFDILVVLDSNGGEFKRGGVALGSGLGSASPNHKYDEAFQKSDGSGVSPQLQLLWLKRITDAALQPFGVKAAMLTSQSVTVTIGSSGTTVELVPAGIFQLGWADPFFNIPSGQADGWTLTQPDSDRQRVELAAQTRPGLRHIIRTLKNLNTVYQMGMPSFAIESAVLDAVPSIAWCGFEDLNLLWCLDHVAAGLKSCRVPDPYDPASNLLAAHPLTAPVAGDLYSAIANRIRQIDAAGFSEEAARAAIFKLLGNE